MCGIIFRGPWVVDGVYRTKKKKWFGLVAEPFTADLSLNFSADPSLKINCFSFGLKVGGEVFAILKVYSVFHFVSFPFFFSVFIIAQVFYFVNTFYKEGGAFFVAGRIFPLASF